MNIPIIKKNLCATAMFPLSLLVMKQRACSLVQ
jgi:hypothetical protein